MNRIPGDRELSQLAQQILDWCKERDRVISTAESCTGGWIAKLLTDIPGSSAFFDRGFVTYSNDAKQDMLAVPADVIEQFGAVSEQTVTAMANGAILHSKANCSVAVSGIAGPSGGSPEKPVGLVCFAWAFTSATKDTSHEILLYQQSHHFDGDRDAIRRQAVEFALSGIQRYGS